MPSTFFGLTIAGSALNSFHVATNTLANNISNVNTKGYSRQEALAVMEKEAGKKFNPDIFKICNKISRQLC